MTGTISSWAALASIRLRAVDQSDRDRDSVKAMVGYNPTDQLSLGFSLDYTNDEYDSKYYGIQDSEGYRLGLDASYAVNERITLFGYYARDDFDTDLEDVTDTVGFGASIDLIVDKLRCDLSLDYSSYTGDYNTSNPNYIAGQTTSAATGYNWDDLETDTTSAKIDFDYAYTESLSFGLHYLYEKFDLSDFATDDVSPYGNPADIQGNSLDYFIFMDSNFDDYDAHQVSLTVTYEF